MEENLELKEKDLDALYLYILINWETFTNKEKELWHELLSALDSEFQDYD